jgi:hypothetical protein
MYGVTMRNQGHLQNCCRFENPTVVFPARSVANILLLRAAAVYSSNTIWQSVHALLRTCAPYMFSFFMYYQTARNYSPISSLFYFCHFLVLLFTTSCYRTEFRRKEMEQDDASGESQKHKNGAENICAYRTS